MNKKKTSLLIIFILSLVFTTNVKAISVKENKMWSDELGLKNVSYNTRKGSGSLSRQTKHIGGFRECPNGTSNTCDGDRWFCVEPGTPLESGNVITGASKSSTRPNKSDGWTWDVTARDDEQLSRVLSCWYGNNYSIVATQVIAWEIVTEERYNILSDKILSGTYKPYLKDGSSTFGASSGVTSLYELIANVGSGQGKLGSDGEASRKKLYSAYKEVLECAARFDKKPSKSYEDKNTSKKNAVSLSNYNASTQTFSTTVSDKLLNYYKIDSGCDSGFSCSLKDGKLTVSTKKASSSITLTLRYSYITKSGLDGSAHTIRSDSYNPSTGNGVQYLLKENASSPKPQAMARAGKTKLVHITFKSGTHPNYQLQLTKEDDAGNKMSGVQFYICSANKIKSGQSCNNSNKLATITTNSEGVATYKEITSIGQYVAQEVSSSTPAGYVTDTTPANFSVIASNTVGTASYAKASRTFVNKRRHLKMLKRTLDANGKVVDLEGDTCPKQTCDNQGPAFNIKINGKKVCVTRAATDSNQYTYAGVVGLNEACGTGKTDLIETCNGKFDIELIPSGTYEVTEVKFPCGMTSPTNPTQTVVVKPDTPVTTVTMFNGVTGLVFTKVTEDGTPLDGGKFALQKKNNGIYEDMLLVHTEGVVYEYKSNATTETANATYLLDTTNGIINVKGLPNGEYRMVEKQAPSGYDLIKEKDSTAKVTISDAARSADYYQIKLVNQKTMVEGSSDQAEIVVTIKTGRNVINYPLVVGVVLVVLVGAIIIRRKMKK